MRGLIYPLIVMVPILIMLGLAWWAVRVVRHDRKRRAIRDARWESYTQIEGNGRAAIGAHRIARWGNGRELILKVDEVGTVHTNNSAAMLEAQAEAEMRVCSYNALLPAQRIEG